MARACQHGRYEMENTIAITTITITCTDGAIKAVGPFTEFVFFENIVVYKTHN